MRDRGLDVGLSDGCHRAAPKSVGVLEGRGRAVVSNDTVECGDGRCQGR